MKIFLTCTLFLVLFLTNQCTIQKRVYRPGWYVDFKCKTPPYQAKTTIKDSINTSFTFPENKSTILEVSQYTTKSDFISKIEISDISFLHLFKDSLKTDNEQKLIVDENIHEKENLKNSTPSNLSKISHKKEKTNKHSNNSLIWNRLEKLIVIVAFFLLLSIVLISLYIFMETTTILLLSIASIILFYLIIAGSPILLIMLLVIPTEEFLAKQRLKKEKRMKVIEQERQNQESIQQHNSESTETAKQTANSPVKDKESTKIKTLIAAAVGTVLILFYFMLSR